jgi:manganese/iron transport system substrate-binding protein
MIKNLPWILIAVVFCVQIPACAPANTAQSQHEEQLYIVATTTIVADVVSQVAGDLVRVDTLLPAGIDPHSFDPTPQDMAKISDADLIFANGAGLETFLDNLVENAAAESRVVHVSEGVDFIETGHDQHEDEDDLEEGHRHTGVDPHTWTDPNNVIVWVANIERQLAELDPANKQIYADNTAAYTVELEELDAWVRQQVSQVPAAERRIVSDHLLFGYFVRQYGFIQVGALIPGYSTLAEPSARELAALEDAVRELEVKAIFVGNTVSSSLAERVAEDTGTHLITVYTGSLGGPESEAGTYLDYIRYNVSAFVNGLK